MKRLILSLIVLAVALPRALAQDNANPTRVTVNVGAERLESLLTDEQKQSVTHLTVTGTLQEADYAYLRAGLLEQLEELNLRDADIDTIPAHAFDCELNQELFAPGLVVTLPSSLIHLSDYALCTYGDVKFVLTGRYPSLGNNIYKHNTESETLLGVEMDVSQDNPFLEMYYSDIYSKDGQTLFYWGCNPMDIRKGTKVIAGNAFENCIVIEDADILLPSTIDSIGDRAFANVGMAFITSLDDYDLLHGTHFICEAVMPPKLGRDVFCDEDGKHTDFVANATLCVPDESIELYKNADGWGEFYTIKGLSSLVSGIHAITTNTCISVNDNGAMYSLSSDKEIKSIDSFNANGSVIPQKKNIHANSVEISKSSLSFPITIVRVNYADGTSETLKLRP